MEPALSLQRTKFNQLIQWFTGCEKQPDELFTALAGGLGITPHALSQILTVTRNKSDHNLEYYLLNELSMAQQYQYVQAINQLLEPGRLLHGVDHYLDPDKWMCFMQTLHDVVHDPDPLFRLNTGKYYECVSRVSAKSISPPVREIVEEHEDEKDDIGLGTAPTTSMSPDQIARERVKAEIKELIHKILMSANQRLNKQNMGLMGQLKLMINKYLEDGTITRKYVCILHRLYLQRFRRTNQRKTDDLDGEDVSPQQKRKNIYENAIVNALAEFCEIKMGGKRTRGRKSIRRRKSIHRRKKSIRR